MAKKLTVKTTDLLDLASTKFDLLKTWPYPNDSVKEISCIHKLEYVSGRNRIPFMEEAYRVLEPGGKINILVCYWSSPRSIQDPSYEWPPMCENSFLYFNKGWRETNKLSPIKCDFDFTYGYQAEPEMASRSSETQSFWIKHYLNAATDLQLVLVKR